MICIYQPILLMTFFILCCLYNGDTKVGADWQLKFYVFINEQFNPILIQYIIYVLETFMPPLGYKFIFLNN